MPSRFVGLCGRKQTGKDTTASLLKQQLIDQRYTVKITSFAYPLKQKIAVEILGLDPKIIFGSNEDKETKTPYKWENMPQEICKANNCYGGFMTHREVLQVIGTDIFRNFFTPDIWARQPFQVEHLDSFGEPYHFVILTDLRFPEEHEYLKKNNGYSIKITRKAAPKDGHASETQTDNIMCDETITNNDTIETLIMKLEGLVPWLTKM